MPFKFDAAALAQEHLTPRAALAGAVNVLSLRDDGIHGDNSDGIGLVADIEHNAGVALAGCDLLLIGAGGAAAGVLGPLIEAGCRRIVVANRTLDKAVALVQRHARWRWRTMPRWRRSRCTRCRAASTWSSTARPPAWRAAKCRLRPTCSGPARWQST